MSKINFHREHQLDKHESRALAEELLNKLVDKYGGRYGEDGNSFRYNHPAGVNAIVEPNQGEFIINIKLGFMTRALGSRLQGDMDRIRDEYLA